MSAVSRSRRRSSSALELSLLACCVALGSAITISAFGGEVADTYDAATGMLPRTTRSRPDVDLGLARVQTPPTLEPAAVAVQHRLFGTQLGDLIDDAGAR